MKNRVLVVGSINVDYTIGAPRFPVPGETVNGEGFAMHQGGKGANQAVALVRAGCRVQMLGAVGDDEAGMEALSRLRGFGVITSAVEIVTTAPTGAAVITVCKGENTIVLGAGANACVTPETVAKNAAAFQNADFAVMQYEIPSEAVFAAAEAARAAGACVIVNPAPAREMPAAFYPLVDWFIPNETEAAYLTGIDPDTDAAAARAVKALLKRGCRNVLITLGARGCAYSVGDTVAYGRSFPVKAVDTTAAGDSFIGAFTAALANGRSVPEAVRRASATAAMTVERRGAAASIPIAADVDAFLRANGFEA